MPYRYLAICCVLLLVAPPPLRAGAQNPVKPPSVKEQISLIAAGSIVEVKMAGKKQPKIKGRLGAVTDEGFDIQHVKNNQMTTDLVRYGDVKSVKTVSQEGWGTTSKIVVGALAGVGLLFTILIIVAAAHGFD